MRGQEDDIPALRERIVVRCALDDTDPLAELLIRGPPQARGGQGVTSDGDEVTAYQALAGMGRKLGETQADIDARDMPGTHGNDVGQGPETGAEDRQPGPRQGGQRAQQGIHHAL